MRCRNASVPAVTNMPMVRPPSTTAHLKQLRALATGATPAPPIVTLLAFDMTEVELGRAVIEMDAGERYFNPMGTVAGGIVSTLADAAMGTAMATTIEDDESLTTVDVTAKFLKAVRHTRLRAVAQVVKRTYTLGLVECEVTDADGQLVAKTYSTCMVLRGSQAQGR